MEQIFSKLTVFFEEPFWIGVYERESEGKYEVCKIMFGGEPRDYEVYDFLIKNWTDLRFSRSIEVAFVAPKRINPKRMQRQIKKQLQNNGMGTKAQQALKLQHEQGKSERKKRSQEEKEAEKERQFELRQEKRKAKHKGH
ncbi:YjdF family protein [Anaerotignum sp.]|uniref:YjdF family protein n=1 Tax=Anaerotignum sp. TaxID=2039241 RepID=UPI0027145085|nr:YjdF family protein [Anaerotignum sp.]